MEEKGAPINVIIRGGSALKDMPINVRLLKSAQISLPDLQLLVGVGSKIALDKCEQGVTGV